MTFREAEMQKRLAALVLVLPLAACSGDRDARQVRQYVARAQAMDELNREVVAGGARLRGPAAGVTSADVAAARALVERYLEAAKMIAGTPTDCRDLRAIEDVYLRRLTDVRSLVAPADASPDSQRVSVVAALRRIENLTRQHYTALGILWLRTEQRGALGLQWPG